TYSLGRSTVLGGAYYGASALLRKGLTDYQYSAGFLRPNAFGASDRYGGFGYLARYRLGLTDNLSAGGRFEGNGNVQSGGPVVDLGTRIGTFHLGAAVSRSGGIRGAATDLGYSYSSPRFGFGGTVQFESDGYATTSLPVQEDRPVSTTSLFGSYQLSRTVSLSLDATHAGYRDSGVQNNAAAYMSFGLGPINLSVGAALNTGTSALGLASNGTSYFMMMSLAGKGRTSSLLTSTIAGGKTIDSLQVQESVPAGAGFGYRAALSNDSSALLTGDARLNGAVGTYELTSVVPRAGRSDSSFTLAGGVADVDGQLALSRPLTDSFALVEVPGQSNVHVFLNGQDMGATNRAGRLVVTNLVPDYANHVRIDERQTAFDTEISSDGKAIVPGVRSGALVTYGVRKISAFTGKVIVNNSGVDVIPAAGALSLTANAASADSDLGDDGAFYFENVAPGTYDGLVRYAGGECKLTVTVPAASGLITNLGTLTCVQR
ncbi:MAG: fimbria/pilus outer membrane usher protein, partial [Vulcanimicrobiaceae bacterium]